MCFAPGFSLWALPTGKLDKAGSAGGTTDDSDDCGCHSPRAHGALSYVTC